jgi:hypothetical protein
MLQLALAAQHRGRQQARKRAVARLDRRRLRPCAALCQDLLQRALLEQNAGDQLVREIAGCEPWRRFECQVPGSRFQVSDSAFRECALELYIVKGFLTPDT